MAEEDPKKESDIDHILGGVKDFIRYWTKKGNKQTGDWYGDFVEWPFKYGWHKIVWYTAQGLLAIFIWFLLFQRVRLHDAFWAVVIWFVAKYLFKRWTSK